jgi:hypothetical protein
MAASEAGTITAWAMTTVPATVMNGLPFLATTANP